MFPSVWKINSVTPVYKKGDKTDIINYKSISSLVQIGKLFKKIILNII